MQLIIASIGYRFSRQDLAKRILLTGFERRSFDLIHEEAHCTDKITICMIGEPNRDTKLFLVAVLVKPKPKQKNQVFLFNGNFAFYMSRTYCDLILNSKYSFSV